MKHILPIPLFFFLLRFSLFAPVAKAQVVINEFSPASNPEWVELYNSGSETILLKGFTIHFHDNFDIQSYNFCDDEEIAGNSYKLITLSSNWLKNDGDILTLKKEETVEDSIAYGTSEALPKLENSQSATRDPDGSSDWVVSDTPSQQGDSVSFDCPTPIPSPTPSPSPDSSPTPTPTPSPSPSTITTTTTTTTTKKKSPKPTLEPVAFLDKSDAENSSQILGETANNEDEDSKEATTSGFSLVKGGILSWILTGSGLLFLLAAGVPFMLKKFRSRKKPASDDKPNEVDSSPKLADRL